MLLSCSQTQKARSRLLSRAGRFGLVPSTTLSPSVRRGYALGSMGTFCTDRSEGRDVSDDPNIIALISRSLAQTARSRLLSWAGRFGLVPSTTLSPSVRRVLHAAAHATAHAPAAAAPSSTPPPAPLPLPPPPPPPPAAAAATAALAALAHPIAPRCFPRHVVAHAAAPSALTAVAGRYPRRRPTHRHRPCRCHTWPTYRRRP